MIDVTHRSGGRSRSRAGAALRHTLSGRSAPPYVSEPGLQLRQDHALSRPSVALPLDAFGDGRSPTIPAAAAAMAAAATGSGPSITISPPRSSLTARPAEAASG